MELNYLAILVCGIANLILGSIWFGPLFGKQWMKYANIQKPEVLDSKVKLEMMKSYGLMFLASLVMAYILSNFVTYVLDFTNQSGAVAGMWVGFWAWLGFVLPTSIGVVLWEGKPWASWSITYIYYLISLIMFGGILAMWM